MIGPPADEAEERRRKPAQGHIAVLAAPIPGQQPIQLAKPLQAGQLTEHRRRVGKGKPETPAGVEA